MSSCVNKYGVPKRRLSNGHRVKAEALIMTDKKHMEIRAYHCWNCKYWHVGTYSKPDTRDYIARFADMIAGGMRGHEVPWIRATKSEEML